MKAKPTNRPGEVVLELNRRDELFMDASVQSPFTLKKILVPTDFSECSLKALRYAVALAKGHEAAITLLYVAPSTYVASEYGRFDYPSFEADVRGIGEKQLAGLAADEVPAGLSAKTTVRTGSPASEIVDLAKKLPADIIVISTHGRTGLKQVFLGSVAEHIVRHAPCPVLVVREQEHDFVT